MWNFLKKIIRFGSKIQLIKIVSHYNVFPQDAFEICRNYEDYLSVQLRVDEGPFNFEWVKGGPGEVGAVAKYGMTHNGSHYTIWDEITKLEVDEETGVHTLAWKKVRSDPWMPLRYHCKWEIKPSSYAAPGEPRCDAIWTRSFPTPYLFGIIPIGGFLRKNFYGTDSVITNFIFRQYYAQEFPSPNRRLPKKGDRVAIIGAGPSGLHMAHLLKNKLGIENIEILERSDRYGGKTVTVESETNKGVVHELGTCYMHPAYFEVRAYMQELKEMMGHEAPPGFAAEVDPIHYSVRRPGKEDLDLEGWVTANLQVQPNFSLFALFRILFPRVDTKAELLLAKEKYNLLHRKVFGWYDYTMPPRLTQEQLASIDMSYGQFLEQHDLTALIPILAYGNTAQGYGSIHNIPAFWGMCWITPDLMDGYFRLPTPKPARKVMFKIGWQSMWDATVKVNQLDIEKNVDIDDVDRREDGAIVITGKQDGMEFEREFDYLVVAAPLYNSQPPSPWETTDGVPNKTVPLRLKADEAHLLQSSTFTHSQFRTILFKLEDPRPYLFSHLQLNSDKIFGPDTGQGDVFASRDSYLAHNPQFCTPKGHTKDPLRGKLREQMAYQWFENTKDVTLALFEEKFDEWATAELGSKEHYKVRMEKHWDYFQRYDRDGLNQFFPWKVLDLQGVNRTLFVHASTYFESVLDIVNYNNMLVDGLSGRLNMLTHPKQFEYSSKAVADNPESPPLSYLQRPFYYQTDYWKDFYGKFAKFLFIGLDIVLGSIWTVLYLLLNPILSVTLVRWGRYQLQKSFKTENIGKWYQFSMKHFLKVSPSVICYINEAKNRKHGNHKLDTVDPVMRVTRKVLAKDYPSIPKVEKALMLSYSDYRTVVRVWMDQIKPNFLTFIGPRLQSFFSSFARKFPIIFNYIGSWATVPGYNILTGYSVRVEDDKGGGCYVPKCKLLATARKEYGDELGCHVCANVCKAFTEAAFERKGISVTLEPNFKKGSCMIRSVPTQTPAFQDHSLFNGMTVVPEPDSLPDPH